MNWLTWREHFETNATRPLPPKPSGDDELPPSIREPVLWSLARFEIGESGEGRIAMEIDRCMWEGINDDYRAALKLFVKEEWRHGSILKRIVRSYGAPLFGETWNERLFVFGRRLIGVRLKLVVLCAAEVIGVGFYGAVAAALPPGRVRWSLEQIIADEDVHLRFHAAFFRTQTRSLPRLLLWRAAWWAVALAACTACLLDHRKSLLALGVPLRPFIGELIGLIARADRLVRLPGHALPAEARRAVA